MAYTLDSIDFTIYDIGPGRIPGGNVSLKGMFDLPERIGKTFHKWDDSDGIEAYTDATEIFFGGREITYRGVIFGTNAELYAGVKDMNDVISAVTGVTELSTPYGDFDVYVKSVKPEFKAGSAVVKIAFREPVVDLTGGALPSTGASDYQIDGRPFTSFGLYTNTKKGMNQLEEKEGMEYTKYGAESIHPTKRGVSTLVLKAYLIGSGLSDFQSKVEALYLLFSGTGEREIKINSELYITCFADKGFKITDVIYGDEVIAKFKIELKITNFSLSGF